MVHRPQEIFGQKIQSWIALIKSKLWECIEVKCLWKTAWSNLESHTLKQASNNTMLYKTFTKYN